MNPSGAGPRVLVELARKKIERTLARSLGDGHTVHVGLLTKNPESPDTEAPIAVVCEFSHPIGSELCSSAQRLAWNFARTPLLITVEPHLVRSWSCCEIPADSSDLLPANALIEDATLHRNARLSASDRAAHALHWVRLATGEFFQRFPDRFKRDQRADRVLLQQLTIVRKKLERQNLHKDTIHDLLARVVFSQFLFDRKDANGQAALNPSLLAKLRREGHLKGEHTNLATILEEYDEAYRFFRWLNHKFNGDLFPGKGTTKPKREAEWRTEMETVKPLHLKTLADFVGGSKIDGQLTLWKLYSFDVIPLEFISSIYEEFVTSKGAHYTPPFLVDFMLDEVLPWGGKQWNLKVLDPACGSGIFLVKAYQRLIQRWKNAHAADKLPTPLLRRLLERNLFGVDIDEHAVRVASFSLYLTMCDEIDPKNYLRNTKFPRLREHSLVASDFFAEDKPGFGLDTDAAKYDLVVGNAPWGQESATELARHWASRHEWPIPDKGFGTLFMPKAAALTKRKGRVCMIQPASCLLFNRSGTACRFRKRLFEEFKVDEVVNLSILRFQLFGAGTGRKRGSVSPTCIVTLHPIPPDDQPVIYISPKEATPSTTANVAEFSFGISVEPHDMSQVWPEEAATDSLIWTSLSWGGRRDLALVRRLSQFQTLEKYKKGGVVATREGIIRGKAKKKRQHQIVGRALLDQDDFPQSTFLFLDPAKLPINHNPWTHWKDSTSLSAFQLPQLIIKQAWIQDHSRFRAAIVRDTPTGEGVLCSQSYVSVHAPQEKYSVLESAALSYNSVMAVYFLRLSSGRFASYRPEPLAEEIRRVPLATIGNAQLDRIQTQVEIDARVRRLFGFKDAEWVLVEDLVNYTLRDFKGNSHSPGRQHTARRPSAKSVAGREPHLAAYCEYFIRVLKAGFGRDKHVCATIFQDTPANRIPVRLVAIHLDAKRDEDVAIEQIESALLCERLVELDRKFLKANPPAHGGIFFQRVARVYEETQLRGRAIPTIYIVKPDRVRYWTRSAALRDADEVAADIVHWGASNADTHRARRPK